MTGSNMSGKSTFLRTVGVNVVLAQTIHTSLASSYQAPVFTVRSCIGRADDLIAGKSYYLVEVEALLELVRASGGDSTQLFLLHELFRGTNAVERIAAGQAVLEELIGPIPHPNRMSSSPRRMTANSSISCRRPLRRSISEMPSAPTDWSFITDCSRVLQRQEQRSRYFDRMAHRRPCFDAPSRQRHSSTGNVAAPLKFEVELAGSLLLRAVYVTWVMPMIFARPCPCGCTRC